MLVEALVEEGEDVCQTVAPAAETGNANISTKTCGVLFTKTGDAAAHSQ